jgi:RNA polymerase sigma factor (sigma-70 family)
MLDTGDLVQDAVINALRNLNSIEIRDEGSLQSYLQRAVKNRIIDLYRRKGRRPARDTMPEAAAALVTAPDEAAIRAEDLRRYRAALSRLREDDRKAVILWVERGLPHRDIAVELNKPSAAAARMTVNRALERLAREMRRGPSS